MPCLGLEPGAAESNTLFYYWPTTASCLIQKLPFASFGSIIQRWDWNSQTLDHGSFPHSHFAMAHGHVVHFKLLKNILNGLS